MDWFVVEKNIITNIIVAEPDVAYALHAKPIIKGKGIGDRYDDTLTNEELTEENKILKAQVGALSDRNDFLEDCIAEMAGMVYTTEE